MKIVLDTNVILVSVSRKSPFHWVFQNLIDKNYSLCFTTDILLEYEEVIARHMDKEFAAEIIDLLLEIDNHIKIDKYFQWNLLQDQDDDKFVDCAIASNADYLVTEDSDFRVLLNIPFPKVSIIGIEKFKSLLQK
ncbi:MAG: putative toxin-antitoxin system toxin component, PIN family [Saprospiraceae bacterium]|nr:putative toxin-antitoxin system toxin component, PIN family [Saprospiraceae bacterium]